MHPGLHPGRGLHQNEPEPKYAGTRIYQLGMMKIVDLEEPLSSYAGPDYWNDPDMLEMGNGGVTGPSTAPTSHCGR